MKAVQQWEYRVETVGSFFWGIKDEQLSQLLNDWGEEGWEIINLVHPPNYEKMRVIAKRPVDRPARRPRRWSDEL
jgi:hypothetical protein